MKADDLLGGPTAKSVWTGLRSSVGTFLAQRPDAMSKLEQYLSLTGEML
jgi:hypothetical protein